MKVIKKINNNFALALDANDEEVVIYGKGVGFKEMPYEIDDLSQIDRTYYNVSSKYYQMGSQLPDEIIDISVAIVDECRKRLRIQLNPNLLFVLADHIDFTIQRKKKNIVFNYPVAYDMEHYYEEETEIAKYALKLIRKRLNITLPKSEVTGITMNIVNAEMANKTTENDEKEKVIDNITRIIEKEYDLEISKQSANYSRYVTHMHFLLDRIAANQTIETHNQSLMNNAKSEFPLEYHCSNKIADYLEYKYETKITEEEKLYIMLHINRLCAREGM